MTAIGLLLFILFSAIGAVVRYIFDVVMPRNGILVVNLLGSSLAGGVAALSIVAPAVPDQLSFSLIVGLAGALTTFATVSAHTAMLVLEHQWGQAVMQWMMHLLGAFFCAAGTFTAVYLLFIPVT